MASFDIPPWFRQLPAHRGDADEQCVRLVLEGFLQRMYDRGAAAESDFFFRRVPFLCAVDNGHDSVRNIEQCGDDHARSLGAQSPFGKKRDALRMALQHYHACVSCKTIV